MPQSHTHLRTLRMVRKARPQLSAHSVTIRITSAENVTVRILSQKLRTVTVSFGSLPLVTLCYLSRSVYFTYTRRSLRIVAND